MNATQPAHDAGRPAGAPAHRRTDQVGVFVIPEAYQSLKALAETTNTPMRHLLTEAVALLLLEHSEPVPAALRRKLRLNIPGLD